MLLGGCAERAPDHEQSATGGRAPVLIFAVDGLEWNELLPLSAAGDLPVLTRLMEQGRYGLLRSMVPSVSPVIWTTIATGKPPDEHGIQGFAKEDAAGNVIAPFNNWDRRTKAFWNIVSDAGLRVAVIGWWMTYPVDPVNGLMVAQVNTLDALGGALEGGLNPELKGQVWPPDRQAGILARHEEVSRELDRTVDRIFGGAPATPGNLERKLWTDSRWAMRADATYLDIARSGAPDYDVTAVYVGGTDVISHRFWRYAHPNDFASRPTAEQVDDLGDLVDDYYRYADAELGRILERYRKPVTVIVLSDHGMESRNTEFDYADADSVAPVSGHHDRGRAGVVILSGPGIVPGTPPRDPSTLTRDDLPVIGSILDVTPTLLTLLGVPVGADMSGVVWNDVLDPALPRPEPVPTWDDAAWTAAVAARDPDTVAVPAVRERLDQLRALGYIQ